MTGFQKELCRAQSQGSEQMIRRKHPWIAMAMLAIMLLGSNQARSAEAIVRIANSPSILRFSPFRSGRR